MDKAYSRIVWQNQPSTATALGATNLNKTDVALNTIDDRVVGMDTSKANQSTVNSVVQSITYNESTGVLTITKVNGTSTNIDTKLEKLAVNFAYNPTTQQLDITLDDGTVQHVDMSALVTQYEFDNTGTIAFTLTAGRVTANVVNGSITAEKLHPDYLANLTVQAQIAEENKNIAIEQAGIATDAAGDAETYRDQALQYRNEAEGIVGVGIATESVPGLVKGAGNVSIETNGDMWAEPYKDKATQSGQSVQFPTADNGLVEIINIQGKYSQAVTVQGKQLFDKVKVSAAKYIQPVTGTETTSSFSNNASPKIYTGTETNVTISGHTYVQPNTPVGIAFYNSSNARIGGTSYQNATGNGTYAIPAGTFYLRYTINNVDLNTSQAEFGTVATSYAAYIPNSPSPDYPSVIHNVGDVPFNFGAIGKNKFDGILEQGSFNPTTGLTESNLTRVRSVNHTVLSAGTYRISFSGAQAWVMYVYDLNNNYLSAKSLTAWQTNFTFTLDNTYKVKFAFKYTNDANILPSDVTNKQVEPGTTATPYEPYKGNQTPVTGQYGALPDGTRDEFVSDGTTAKDIKRKGRVILNGTESFSLNGASRFSGNYVGFDYAGINTTMLTGYNVNGLLCTHFEQLASGSNYQKPGIMKPNTSGGIVFGINKSLLTGWDDGLSNTAKANLFKAWLTAQYTANTPVMLDYALVAPIESPRDRIFLTSYSGITNVYTTDPLQPTFTAVAKSELWSDRRNYLLNFDYNTPHYYYEGNKFLLNNPYRFGGILHIKGPLHCHTTNSDGLDTPTALVTAYKNTGYGFATITDHNTITNDPGVSGITWIGNSYEASYLRHVICYDVTDYPGLQSSQDVMTYHSAKSQMTGLAHPHWRNQYVLDEFEIKSYYDHNFIEVYNAKVGGYAEEQWDWALSAGRIVFATAVDDCHDSTSLYEFNKGWVVVHVNTNTKNDILQSLRNGNFYASTGNDITISLNGNTITASSVASSNFTFIGRNGKVLKTASGVISATYTILGDESYVRVKSELASDVTKKAFSQPIFIEAMREQHQYADIYRNLQLSGINRQALNNGGPDIWQSGESFSYGNVTLNTSLADRWAYTQSQGSSAATVPSLTVSKMPLPLDYVPLAHNYMRFSYTSVGTSAGNDFYSLFNQYIEEGIRLLGAVSKKITFSFYARSTIPGKKIGIDYRMNFGTGGTPSTQIDLPGGVMQLTDYFKRYSITITLPDLTGYTFGTNNDSYLRPTIWLYWGSAFNSRINAASSEFPGATGIVDFAAMTLNSTDIALPYMPKTYAEELRDCQRYNNKTFESGSSTTFYATAMTATALVCNYTYPVPMRKNPTITISRGGTVNQIRKTIDGTILNASSITAVGNKNILSYLSVAGITLDVGAIYEFDITANAEY